MDTLFHLDICLKECGLSWKDVVSIEYRGFSEVVFSTRENMNLKKLVYKHATIREIGQMDFGCVLQASVYKMKVLINRSFDLEVLAKLQQEEARFETLLKNRTFVSGPSLGEELVRLASMYGVTTPVVTLKLSENK